VLNELPRRLFLSQALAGSSALLQTPQSQESDKYYTLNIPNGRFWAYVLKDEFEKGVMLRGICGAIEDFGLVAPICASNKKDMLEMIKPVPTSKWVFLGRSCEEGYSPL
jgi:hypothetical protein